MIINANGKKEGWEGQGICIFYENGVGTKISSNAGIQDFNDFRDAMYVQGLWEYVFQLEGGVMRIFNDCAFDIEFLKRILPYKHFTWKDKEPRKYTFIENFEF